MSGLDGLRVLMIVSNDVDHDGRVLAEAQSLTTGGARVTVIGWDRASSERSRDRAGDVEIVRLPTTRSMALLGYDLLRLPFWRRNVVGEAERMDDEDPFDVIHCHDLDTLEAGIQLKRRCGVPLVYDAHEIWGYMVEKDLPWPLPDYFLWREKRYLQQVDHVVTVNSILADRFRGLGDAPVTVVMNAKPLQVDRYRPPDEEVFTAFYAGGLHEHRFVHGMIDAVHGLEDVRLRVAGSGSKAYARRMKERMRDEPAVEFLGRISPDEVLEHTLRCHAVLLMDDPSDPNTEIALSNKLFEAMACGRPIVSTEGTNDSRVVAEEGMGLVVPCTVPALREVLRRLRDDGDLQDRLGRAALEAARGEYNWEVQAERLREAYANVRGAP